MKDITFIEHLIDLAVKDNQVTEKEKAILYERGKACGLTHKDIDALIALKLQESPTPPASPTPPTPPTPPSSTLDNMVDDRPAFWNGGWKTSGEKLILNLLPWSIVLLLSFVESITNHPLLSVLSWWFFGSNVVFLVVLAEHSIELLLIWALVQFLKRNVFNSLFKEKVTKRLKELSLPPKGERSLSELMHASLQLPGWGWKIACVLFVIGELKVIVSGDLFFGSFFSDTITLIVSVYAAVYIPTVLYLYFFHCGTKKRRTYLFSVLGGILAIFIVYEILSNVDFSNLRPEKTVAEWIAEKNKNHEQLARVVDVNLERNYTARALKYAEIDYEANQNDELMIKVANRYRQLHQDEQAYKIEQKIHKFNFNNGSGNLN